MFILRETFRFLRHSRAAWVLQSATLGVALGLSGLFLLLAWNAHRSLQEIRSNLTINVFFDPALSSGDARLIAAEIQMLPGIGKTQFISKEEAAEDYARESGEDVERTLGMNPLPASVKIYLQEPSATNLEIISSRVQTLSGVENVKSDAHLVSEMESRSRMLDRIALILSLLIILSALFQSVASARHAVERRKQTNLLFDRLGASPLRITMPMILFSALTGVGSGIIAAVIVWFTYDRFFSAMKIPSLPSSLPAMNEFSIFFLLIAAGLSITVLTMSVALIGKRKMA